jgi:caa(3)-type oxidase subunit IV
MAGGGHAHSDAAKYVPIFLFVLAALVAGTVVTVLAAQVHLAGAWNIVIALFIALIKGSLVAAVFMHLKWETAPSIWWVLGICGIFFLALMLLPLLTATDLPPQARTSSWG